MALPDDIEGLDPEPAQACQSVQLLKALYGLKQTPLLWWQEIDGFLLSCGLHHSAEDANLYIGSSILVLPYADDMLIVHRDQLASPSLSQGRFSDIRFGRSFRFAFSWLSHKFHSVRSVFVPAVVFLFAVHNIVTWAVSRPHRNL